MGVRLLSLLFALLAGFAGATGAFAVVIPTTAPAQPAPALTAAHDGGEAVSTSADTTPAPAEADPASDVAAPAQPIHAEPRRVAAPSVGPVVIIPLAGEVNDFNRDALIRQFARARALGARTVIIDIDTYGGLVTSGLDISRFLKRQTDIHTIAFVKDKAISAGAMIAVACDEIVMAPYTTLGDCAPIIFQTDGTLQEMKPAERAKEESPVVNEFLDSARRNGYDPLLLKSMVNVETVVYCVQSRAGERRFVDEAEFKSLTAAGAWKPAPDLPIPIDGPDTLLTVHADEAVQLGLASGIAPSAAALAAQRGETVAAVLSPTVGDKIIEVLGGGVVRGLLLTIFLTALYICIQAPGHGLAETVAVVALGLLVGVPLLTGYAQWWDLALIFGGLALVAFELFVFPGHMVSITVGSVMVLAGVLLTFMGNVSSMPGVWHMPATWTDLRHGMFVVATALVASVGLSVWLRRFLPRMPYFGGLILTATSGGSVRRPGRLDKPSSPGAQAAADRWPFIGSVGRANGDLKPGGLAEFPCADDTRMAAVTSEAGYVKAGSKVLVREISGSKIVVRPLPE